MGLGIRHFTAADVASPISRTASEELSSHDSGLSSRNTREAGATPDPFWHSGSDTDTSATLQESYTATPRSAVSSSSSASEESVGPSNLGLPVLSVPYHFEIGGRCAAFLANSELVKL